MTEYESPARAWQRMKRGNARFVSGGPRHPRQDVERRQELATSQAPSVALFGCADSRLAAEIIFDKGLGDLFVVRNAGQIISDSVIGSLEYAVAVLHVPLIVVLAHDNCGAVRATIDSVESGVPSESPHIQTIINSITPAVEHVQRSHGDDGSEIDAALVGKQHLRHTVMDLVRGSEIISAAVTNGTLGIVGANYELVNGTASAHVVFGDIDHENTTGRTTTTRSAP
ncbi:carbonic anhydrase [Mycetocola reblochoni]|uniref:carbonic anhydrase n=2 Tax=Mycetocola reblochoni TaxID=331618 RepID=A0A1R4IB34_9MICO|nr:carbonic anhydrase [Mycetocola reblochoni]RLP67596.1 carbonic anhydrase [Mycetocola reblochoni]SJN16936.1 Carbonic anhydrase [Mycetocola reblochoni REB411]